MRLECHIECPAARASPNSGKDSIFYLLENLECHLECDTGTQQLDWLRSQKLEKWGVLPTEEAVFVTHNYPQGKLKGKILPDLKVWYFVHAIVCYQKGGEIADSRCVSGAERRSDLQVSLNSYGHVRKIFFGREARSVFENLRIFIPINAQSDHTARVVSDRSDPSAPYLYYIGTSTSCVGTSVAAF